jgi:hypothetical protein
MPKLPTWAWIGIAVVAVYLAWKWMGTSKAQSWGPIKVTYSKIGVALDAMGVPFNSPGSNPGR